jgi:hypothetical protein
MQRKHRLIAFLTILIAVGGCSQVDFTAPTGSTITMTAQPPTVAANGFSNITVVGTRENGAPLPDGTSVTFTATLGTVAPNPAETKDGVAFARFKAGTRSGTATVSASSGEATGVTTDIVVGEARPNHVTLVASPIQLPVGGGTVRLKAHVLDESGNPLGGVGVIFTTTAGTLDSRGRVIRANDSGTADDILRTTVAAEVTATTLNNTASGVASVSIGAEQPCTFVISPPSPNVGEEATFTDTTNASSTTTLLWDFGDGGSAEGAVVTHSYDSQGTFTVVHTIIDAQGFSTVCTQEVTVENGRPTCSFTFDPADPETGEQVTFDASDSSDADGFIVTYSWNFHDGSPQVSQASPVIVHSFPAVGTFPVELTVTDDEGNETICAQSVFVSAP